MNGDIKDPTIRKARNRGFQPINYHTPDEWRAGWIVDRLPKYLLIRLVGDDSNRRVPLKEESFMVKIA